MLRSATKSFAKASPRRVVIVAGKPCFSISALPPINPSVLSSASRETRTAPRFVSTALVAPARRLRRDSPTTNLPTVRTLSSNGGGGATKQQAGSTGGEKAAGGGGGGGPDEGMSQEIVLTPGEKVVAGTRLTMWAGIAVFACACAYYIGKELMPSKMSPNTVFDKAVSVVRENPEVQRRFGTPLKAYGRDHGGHREGRRNFIEHTEYKDKDDGTKRTRVRFNLEGKFGKAFVFAEVSSDMPSGEFVYVLVQDKSNGRVITIVDNRSALLAKRMAGGSKEGMEAFGNLLSGSGKN